MSTGREPRAGTPFIFWIISGVVLLTAVIGMFTSALYDNPPEPQQVPAAAGNTPADVVSNSNFYMGQRVTLNGQVQRIISPQALSLSTESNSPDESLLVLASRPEVLSSVSPGGSVQLSGTVKRFVAAEASKEAGIQLPQEQFGKFEGKPYLMAESALAPR